MNHYLNSSQISLGPIDAVHIRVFGVIKDRPAYAYPLERFHYLSDRSFLTTANDYQANPVWDLAGKLLLEA